MNDVMVRTSANYIANKDIQPFLINFLSQLLVQMSSCEIYQKGAMGDEHYVEYP
jgi:hypothetical protein